MKPIDVDSDNEQLLRHTVYNYERLEPTSSSLRSSILINDGSNLKKTRTSKS